MKLNNNVLKLSSLQGLSSEEVTQRVQDWLAQCNTDQILTKPDESSFYNQYIITKTNGQPVDPKADYFVLRLDTDEAARNAAWFYAKEMEETFPELSAELIDRIEQYQFGTP